MFDEETQRAIKARMEILNADKNFKKKIEKEIGNKKGRELRNYIAKAVKISQNERTDKKQ